ncbi:MAG: cysteine desulfurase family protein [Slackia sp.]|nr:cysteine desulfurase family protein [Slackia sp.]
MKRIYLDNAATTPLSAAAAAAMAPYLEEGVAAPFGNANSLHSVGREAFTALEDARARVARAIGATRPDEVVFTSGATEADNAALIGMAVAQRERRRLKGGFSGGRVVVSRIEHDAVLHCASALKRLGFEVDFVENDATGHVHADALEAAMREDTLVVSVMAVNNEVGTVNDTAALARIAHEHGALFHVDAVQALGKIAFSVGDAGADAASFSAHKVGGPKGVGVLYLKTRTPFEPFLVGGGQERGLRSGTQNVAGIVGAAAAIDHAVREREAFAARSMRWRDELYEKLCASSRVVAAVDVAPGDERFAPHIVSVCVRGMESQTLILQLDMRGICVSGGSACSSASLDPSHVLSALGTPRNLAQGLLRISFGEQTVQEDIDAFLSAFEEVVA